MSMYNMLHGMNPFSEVICHLLGIDIYKIERFRDSGIIYEEKLMWIYTRTGGDNERDYPNEILNKHTLLKESIDDSYDLTFKIYYFHFPTDPIMLSKIIKLSTLLPSSKPIDWQEYFDNYEENIKNNNHDLFLQLLSREPLTVDEIALSLKSSVEKVSVRLSLLQLKGEVEEKDGKYYSKIN